MLLENEKQKVADLEKKHKSEVEVWREKIEPRKQVNNCAKCIRINNHHITRFNCLHHFCRDIASTNFNVTLG